MIVALGVVIGILGVVSFFAACFEMAGDNFDKAFVFIILMLVLTPLGFSIAALSSI